MSSPNYKNFLLLWFGQLVSTLGSGLTGFGLGVWVYERTHSETYFSFIAIAAALPGILFSPIAGALVDRWDRKVVMILSDVGAAIGTLAIVLLLWANSLQIWHIVAIAAFTSVFNTFQWPAFSAATSLMVPKEQYGRAAGLVQIGEALSMVGSPLIAGVLFSKIGLRGIVLVDFSTFLFAVVVTLFFVAIPQPPKSEHAPEGNSIWQDAAFGFRYIRQRPGLMGLLTFFLIINFTSGLTNVLYTPLVLSLHSPEALGFILSMGGIGMLLGTIGMSAWGGPKKKVYGVLGFGAALGLTLALVSLPPTVAILASVMFVTMLSLPFLNGSSQAIWMAKVPFDLQGRVFSVRRMIAWFMAPTAFLISGPLAEKIFGPAFMPGGSLSGTLGRIIGVGPGAGIRFMFLAAGLLTAVTALLSYLSPQIRNVESDLPDAEPAPQAALTPEAEPA